MRVRACDGDGRTLGTRNAQYGLWTVTERRGGGGQATAAAATVAVSTAAAQWSPLGAACGRPQRPAWTWPTPANG